MNCVTAGTMPLLPYRPADERVSIEWQCMGWVVEVVSGDKVGGWRKWNVAIQCQF